MKHFALPCFWRRYRQLPKHVRELADKNHKLLNSDPQHPSLQLKKVGTTKQLWSVRVGMHYRAFGIGQTGGHCVVLGWITRGVR